MKKILLYTLFGFLLPIAYVNAAPKAVPADGQSRIEVDFKVPNVGWKIHIDSIYVKNKQLLVICQAEHDGKVHPSQVSEVRATALVKNEYAELPKFVYLLGRAWNWGEDYKAITSEDLPDLIGGGEKIYSAPKKKVPEPNDFIGLTLAEAQALADRHNLKHRVIMLEGKPQPATRDLRPNRLNFTVVDGKVTIVTKG